MEDERGKGKRKVMMMEQLREAFKEGSVNTVLNVLKKRNCASERKEKVPSGSAGGGGNARFGFGPALEFSKVEKSMENSVNGNIDLLSNVHFQLRSGLQEEVQAALNVMTVLSFDRAKWSRENLVFELGLSPDNGDLFKSIIPEIIKDLLGIVALPFTSYDNLLSVDIDEDKVEDDVATRDFNQIATKSFEFYETSNWKRCKQRLFAGTRASEIQKEYAACASNILRNLSYNNAPLLMPLQHPNLMFTNTIAISVITLALGEWPEGLEEDVEVVMAMIDVLKNVAQDIHLDKLSNPGDSSICTELLKAIVYRIKAYTSTESIIVAALDSFGRILSSHDNKEKYLKDILESESFGLANVIYEFLICGINSRELAVMRFLEVLIGYDDSHCEGHKFVVGDERILSCLINFAIYGSSLQLTVDKIAAKKHKPNQNPTKNMPQKRGAQILLQLLGSQPVSRMSLIPYTEQILEHGAMSNDLLSQDFFSKILVTLSQVQTVVLCN